MENIMIKTNKIKCQVQSNYPETVNIETSTGVSDLAQIGLAPILQICPNCFQSDLRSLSENAYHRP